MRLYNSPLTVQFYSADLGDVGEYEVTADDVFAFTPSTTYRWKPYVVLNGGLSFGYACYDTLQVQSACIARGMTNLSRPSLGPVAPSLKMRSLADSVVEFQMPK